jgi:hypothetical protein
MLGGKRTRGLLHWRGNGSRGGWHWWRWPRHGNNLSEPGLKRGGPADGLREGVILEGGVLENLPSECQQLFSELCEAGRAEDVVGRVLHE